MSKAAALVALQKAQDDLAEAERAHEEEFLQKLVDLCNTYGLLIQAGGSEGSRLEIVECRAGTVTTGDFE